jgi:hypothetical protein
MRKARASGEVQGSNPRESKWAAMLEPWWPGHGESGGVWSKCYHTD